MLFLKIMQDHATHLLIAVFLGLLMACESHPVSDMGTAGNAYMETVERKLPKVKRSLDVGAIIDSLDGVPVYYNGEKMNAVLGRHFSPEGYNYGLKWQCVEFIKRYYYDHMDHAFPNPWGHAKDFMDFGLQNGRFNQDRGLYQWRNGSKRCPKVRDILVFGGNDYGHLGIVADTGEDYLELVQQNVGKSARVRLEMTKRNGRYYIRHNKILGWLSKSLH